MKPGTTYRLYLTGPRGSNPIDCGPYRSLKTARREAAREPGMKPHILRITVSRVREGEVR